MVVKRFGPGADSEAQVIGVELGQGLDAGTYNELMLAYARDEATRAEEGIEQVRLAVSNEFVVVVRSTGS